MDPGINCMRTVAAAALAVSLALGGFGGGERVSAYDGTEQKSGKSDETAEGPIRTIQIHAVYQKEYGQKDSETDYRNQLRECITGQLTSAEAKDGELVEQLLCAVEPLPARFGSDPEREGEDGEFRTGSIPVVYRLRDVVAPEEEEAGIVRYHLETDGDSVLQTVRPFCPMEGVTHWITGLEGYKEHRTGREGTKYTVTAADCYEVSSGDGPDAAWSKQLSYCGSPGENMHTFYIRDQTKTGRGRISQACRLIVRIRKNEAEGRSETEEDHGGEGRTEPEKTDMIGEAPGPEKSAVIGEAPETAGMIVIGKTPEPEKPAATGKSSGSERAITIGKESGTGEKTGSDQGTSSRGSDEGKDGPVPPSEQAPVYLQESGSSALWGAYVKSVGDGIWFTGYHTGMISEEKSELRVTRDGVLIRDPALLRKAAREAASEEKGGAGGPARYKLPAALFSEEGVYRVSFVSRDETGKRKDAESGGDRSLVFCIDRTPPAVSAVRTENRKGISLRLEAFDAGGVKCARIFQDGTLLLEKQLQTPEMRAAFSVPLCTPFSGARIRITLEDTAGNKKTAEYLTAEDGSVLPQDKSGSASPAAGNGRKKNRKEKAGAGALKPEVTDRAPQAGIVLAAAFLAALITRVIRGKKDY